MAKQYPRIGDEYYFKARKHCILCNEVGSVIRVDIEVNQFRGDDVVVFVHRKCYDDCGKSPDQILKKYEERKTKSGRAN